MILKYFLNLLNILMMLNKSKNNSILLQALLFFVIFLLELYFIYKSNLFFLVSNPFFDVCHNASRYVRQGQLKIKGDNTN